MADIHSFDISASIDMMEVKNALEIAKKEVANRFDFKGLKAEIELNEKDKTITLISSSDSKIEALKDIVISKLIKRDIPPVALSQKSIENASGGNVKSILKNQKVFVIESDGKFVSKVNTNAIGWDWVQIGGVYTDPLYRRNGYSLCLLSALCRRINKQGRKCVLFVKKKNAPALKLYEKLDFKKSGDFQITYFE